MEKKKKIKIISIVAAIVVVIAICIAVISANSLKIQYSVMYSLMPDYVERTVNDEEIPIKIYKRKNPDFNSNGNVDDYLDAYEFYYYDENGNEVVSVGADPLVYDGVDNGAAFVSFLPGALENLNHLKTVLRIISAIVIALAIIALVVLWFFRWSKKQDAEKEKKFSAVNSNKHKNKTKN